MLQVPSLFESEVRRHVKDMEHYVVMYEEIVEKRRIKRKEEHCTEEKEETEAQNSPREEEKEETEVQNSPREEEEEKEETEVQNSPREEEEEKEETEVQNSPREEEEEKEETEVQNSPREEEKEEEKEETEVQNSPREEEKEETEVESPSVQERDDPKEHCERKRRVTIPISIEDLFKPRSLEAGVDKSEIRKVLLYGNPGSGKTCLSKAIAHKWAMGEIMQEFKAIYVVPVRRLNVAKAKGIRGEALEEVVASTCFKRRGSDDEFEKLKTQINDDLDMSSTLLVFDGLDEADDDARDLLSETKIGDCKLLILTRPYNLRGIQTEVDCQFECLGFNDQQLRNYIIKELQQNEASSLIRSLQQDQGMWENAHTPVTAHILCSLSKEHGTSIENRGKKASMFQIYGDMTNFVWKRFKEKSEAGMANKDIVFGDLEKIAFEGLRKGQILIEERIVEDCATSTNTARIFKETGFLLLVSEGKQYQFPHLTFQEYFAGRFIANSLKNKGSEDERRVRKFIDQEKYNQKHDPAMRFAMNAFAKGRGIVAFQEMLSIVDEQPVEVLGIQHCLLRMRVLDATLQETDESLLEDLLNDEQATKLAENASRLFNCTIEDNLIREIVAEDLKRFSHIFDRCPQVLNETIDKVKISLACKHELTRMEMAKIADALKLVKHSPRHSHEVLQFILQVGREVKYQSNSREFIKRIESVAMLGPQHVGKILTALADECVDANSDVRETAITAIDRVLGAAPQQAGAFLSTLVRGCVDQDSAVRETAFAAISRVLTAAPQHAGEVLPTLVKWRGADDSAVRANALKVVDGVIAAAPQHASEVLPTLMKVCGDDDSAVRANALKVVDGVIAAAPQHASEVLPTLMKVCGDDKSAVRANALKVVDGVIAAAPQHASEVLPTLAKACGDDKSAVRANALKVVDAVIAAAPQRQRGSADGREGVWRR